MIELRSGIKASGRIQSDYALQLPQWQLGTPYEVGDVFLFSGSPYRVTGVHTASDGPTGPTDGAFCEPFEGAGGGGGISTVNANGAALDVSGGTLNLQGTGEVFLYPVASAPGGPNDTVVITTGETQFIARESVEVPGSDPGSGANTDRILADKLGTGTLSIGFNHTSGDFQYPSHGFRILNVTATDWTTLNVSIADDMGTTRPGAELWIAGVGQIPEVNWTGYPVPAGTKAVMGFATNDSYGFGGSRIHLVFLQGL